MSKAEEQSAKKKKGTASIEQLIGMTNDQLLKMSDKQLQSYLAPALEVIPAVDPAKSLVPIRTKGAVGRIRQLPEEVNLEGETGFGGRKQPRKARKKTSEFAGLKNKLKQKKPKTIQERQQEQLMKLKKEMLRDGIDPSDLYRKKK